MQTEMNTKVCPKCGSQNMLTARFCTECKSKLPKIDRDDTDKFDVTSGIPDLAVLGLTDEAYEIAPEDVETMHIDTIIEADQSMGDGAVRLQGNLILTEHETGRVFEIKPENLKEAVIGRASKSTGFNPVIDLSPLQAHEFGVSRRHATISYRDNWLVIIDHNSTNGTFINGRRIVPEQPRVFRDQDTIRVGAILLHVKYGK